MPNKGDLRWREVIEVDGDRVVKRDRYLQKYHKDSWDNWNYWSDIPIEQEVIETMYPAVTTAVPAERLLPA